MQTPDEQRVSEIRARVDGATSGPWLYDGQDYIQDEKGNAILESGDTWDTGGIYEYGDGEFIAHARSDVPYLLDRIAALEQRTAADSYPAHEAIAALQLALATVTEQRDAAVSAVSYLLQRAAQAESDRDRWKRLLLKSIPDEVSSMGGYECLLCGWDVAPDMPDTHEPTCELFDDCGAQIAARGAAGAGER